MSNNPSVSIEIKNLRKSFAASPNPVIDAFNLQICEGEIVCLVGPSGCGKSTLLSLLAGADREYSGVISRAAPTRQIYQQSALLPWLTVAENIALGLRSSALGTEARQEKIDLWLHKVHLQKFGEYYPHELSGGMRQRVELARVLIGEKAILLFDEPFSALDMLTRLKMRQEVLEVLAVDAHTVIWVTHDLNEAVQVADRVLLLAANPLQIIKEYKINSPKPRSPASAESNQLLQEMFPLLGL